MSVRCFASSEPQILSSNLGKEEEPLLNGQYQFHRGEDGLDLGQHHHKEGKVQTGAGRLLHHQGPQHNIVGLLHHHQWKDQDRPGGRLLQPGLHHHLFSESPLPQTQDALDESGPHRGGWGTRPKCHTKEEERSSIRENIWTPCTTESAAKGRSRLRAQIGLDFPMDHCQVFGHAGFIKQTGSPVTTATAIHQSRMTA